jgi:DNA-binding transcriptional regulator WhiA
LEKYQEFIKTSYLETNNKDTYSINEKDNNDLDNWISGFINGEGSFAIHKKGHLVFYIEQAENEVLNQIKKRFNLGPNIVFRAKRNLTFKNTYSLTISSKKDISNLVSFF